MSPNQTLGPTTLAVAPSFAFVISPRDFEQLPFEIADGHVLRRATDAEIVRIKSALKWVLGAPLMPYVNYEHDSIRGRLPREQWRYTVVSQRPDDDISRLEQCANLLSPSLDLGPRFLSSDIGEALVQHGGRIFAFFTSPERVRAKTLLIPSTQLCALRSYFAWAKDRLSADSFVLKGLEAFDEIRVLPSASDAIVLAQFGIIESLVTHVPEPKDTLDSVRRQLRGKLKLLSKRFVERVDPSRFFDTSLLPSDEKLWNKLYDCRSRIAHGGTPDFQKEFKALAGYAQVDSFLREVCRLLLIQGISDESFLSDLRDC